MLKILSNILCDLDPKVKVIGQKAGICDGVPSTSALVLIVFLLSCDCKCSVSLPHGVVGWSAVCDCGIFWTLSFKNCAQHQDCGIFWTLSFKNCAQHRRLPDFIPHIS